MKKETNFIYPLQMFNSKEEMISIEEGQGIYVKDTNGKKYIDGISGLWNVSMGYGNENINNAITTQLQKMPFVNMIKNSNSTTLKFADMLSEATPENLKKVMLTCSGSESNECAIKIARHYYKAKGKNKKEYFLAFSNSYHGTTYAAMTASGIEQGLLHNYTPVLEGFIMIDTPLCRCCEDDENGCLDKYIEELENVFEEHKDRLAGFLIEPVIGSGGIIPLNQRYVDKIKELSEKHDVLIIADEVATGFGRTGKLFASEHYDLNPDMMCLSKGINNGYLPLGAVVLTEEIERVLSESGEFINHISTQNGNPVACASGIAMLEEVNKPEVLEHVQEIGEFIKRELKERIGDYPNIYRIRGKGLMIGIEIVKDKISKEPVSIERLIEIEKMLLKKGLITYEFCVEGSTSGMILFPPYIITQKEASKVVSIIEKVFKKL